MPNANNDSIRARLELSFKESDRVAIFIDCLTTAASLGALNWKPDWSKLSDLFRYLSSVSTINCYLASTSFYTDVKPQADWLSHHGIRTFTSLATEGTNAEGRQMIKSNFDMQLALDMVSYADKVDKIILFSANEDFKPVIAHLQNRGVPTTVITNSLEYTRKLRSEGRSKSTGMVGFALIQQANEFFELDLFRSEIESDLRKSETVE